MLTYTAMKANGKPPNPYPYRRPPWRIALIANLKDDYQLRPDDPPDAGAEFDRQETLDAIARALETEGHWVYFCEADHTLPEALANIRPHMCFNIAEGIGSDGREALVPALCELLGIPYTASRVLANAVGLDKTQTKRIWRQVGLPTAAFEEVHALEQARDLQLPFPLFVKPAREGTGMGVDAAAIVHDLEELEKRVAWVLDTYRQPALVETFLPGREFTVGFIGNPGNPSARRRPDLYGPDGYHWFPILEIDTRPSLSPGVYGHDAKACDLDEQGAPAYLCPADIPVELQNQLIDITRRAAQALGVSDVARVDFRLGPDGQPYLLEINTLPGLNPAVSDLCIMAAAEGMPYEILITEILNLAAERQGLPLAQVAAGLPLAHTPAIFQHTYKATVASVHNPDFKTAA